MKNVEQQAKKMYEAYCAAVGGKAFNGDPLPSWALFSVDPSKQLQVSGWLAAANISRGRMITIVIGNNDSRLIHSEWVSLITQIRTAIKLCCGDALYGCSNSDDDPQNAFWVCSPRSEEDYTTLKESLVKLKEAFMKEAFIQEKISLIEGEYVEL